MQRDKKNIDAAQMQGQIAGAVIATSQKAATLKASSASKSAANSQRMCLRRAGALFLYRKTHTAANRAAPASHARCRGPKWEKPSPSGWFQSYRKNTSLVSSLPGPLHRAEFFSFIIRLFPAACKQDIPPLPPKQASHGTPTPCPPGGRLGCAVPYRKQAASSRAPRLAVNRLFFLARRPPGTCD